MAGFFQSRTADNHLRTLLAHLPNIVAPVALAAGRTTGPDLHYYRTGADLAEIGPADRHRIMAPAFYEPLCGGAPASLCDYRESRLDKALQFAAQQPHHDLSIIVSDLFLTSDAGSAAAPVALTGPLAAILADRQRAIGIVGLKNPFAGGIYDIPGHHGAYTHGTAKHTASRPAFVLLIGPPAQVAAVMTHLDRQVLFNASADTKHLTLFSAPPAPPPQEYRFTQSKIGLHIVANPPMGKAHQIKINPKRANQVGGATIDIDLPAAVGPGHLRLGPQQLWLGRPRCQCGQWVPLPAGPAPWLDIKAQGSGARLTLLGSPAALTGMPGSHLYFLSADVIADPPPPTNAGWLAEWSLSAAEAADELAAKPAFFRALNLVQIHNILTAQIQQLATPYPVGRVNMIIELEI